MPPIPFGFTTTAAEVLADVDLAGKRAVITGATSGIGVETARALAAAGADVVLAVRRIDAGNQTAAQISEATGNPAVTAAQPRRRRPEFGAGLRLRIRRPTGAHADQQRRRHGPTRVVAHAGRPRDAVRHELSRAFRPHPRIASRARGRRRRTGGVGQFQRTPAVAGGVRRHRLPLPALRPVGRVRPIQDRRRAAGRRRHRPLARRRNRRQRTQSRCDRHRTAEAHRRFEHAGGAPQDDRAGRRHVRAARRVTTGRRDRRALLRRLQRITGRHRAPGRLHRRRCPTHSITAMPIGCGTVSAASRRRPAARSTPSAPGGRTPSPSGTRPSRGVPLRPGGSSRRVLRPRGRAGRCRGPSV